MIFRLTTTMLFLFFTLIVSAQKPENIKALPVSSVETILACDQQFAGTIASITAVSAQSNDIGSNITYLCMGDEISIDHANDFNLLDSPNSSDAGIGYVFFDCAPTATGPLLRAVQDDNCTNKQAITDSNGNVLTQEYGVWVAAGQSNGDVNFLNDGSLSRSFEGARGRNPVQFWFAPMTFDDFDTRGFVTDGSGVVGPCVNLNADEAFSVVYLPAIEALQRELPNNNDQCEGRFQVLGGLPSFDNSTYSVSIVKVNDNSVQGTVTSAMPSVLDFVNFTVPEQGEYEITVEDGKSCGLTFRMDLKGCNGITSDGDRRLVAPGDRVCVDVSVNDFTDIVSVQYTLEWDESVLMFDGIDDPTPVFPGTISTGTTFVNDGQLTFSWISPNLPDGVTVPDGTVFYELCFIAIGQVGDFSDILFTSGQTPIEVSEEGDQKVGFSSQVTGFVKISTQAVDLEFEVDTACFAQNDGGFSIKPIAGTPPYSVTYRALTTPPSPVQGPFVINNNGDEIEVTNQSAGTFEVTVTDNSTPPETFTANVDVIERPEIAVNVADPVQEISCFGDTDGILTIDLFVNGLQVNNPDPNLYSFTWNTGDETVVISNLPSRSYSVTVEDQFGCRAMDQDFLGNPFPLSITANISEATCSGADDGALQFVVDEDPINPPPVPQSYNIEVTDPTMMVTTIRSDRYNLSSGAFSGRYDITVIDDNGCRLDTFLIVGALRELSFSRVVVDNVSCNGGTDGQVFIEGLTSPPPAATPYTFNWNSNPPIPNGNTTNTATTSNIENLAAGDYRVRMSDMDGCFIDTTFNVTEPDPIMITLASKTNETCAGMDGTAEVNVIGGTTVGGYDFDWGVPGQTSNDINRLAAGDYTLTVTDDNMCVDSLQFNIGEPSPPVVIDFKNDTIACDGDMDGSLTVTANDGSSAITEYRWSTNESGANLTNITGLTNGEYYVTVVSADGCETIDTALVVAPPPVVIDSITLQSPSCPGENNGLAIVFPSGGTEPYNIAWSTNPASPGDRVLVGLVAGEYTVTITDANSCASADATFTIVDPPSIEIDVDILRPVSCFGATGTNCDGMASATGAYSDGSAGTFNFIWESGEEDMGVLTSTANMLCAGNQRVSVTDGNCGTTEIIMFPSNPPLETRVEASSVSCFGLSDGDISLETTGGQPMYDFTWLNLPPQATDNGDMVTNLPADTFFVNITDANMCTFSTSVIITEPEEFIAKIDTLQTFDVECPGGDNGQIITTFDGGNSGNLSYNWTPNVAPTSSPGAFDLVAGDYSVEITDGRGCKSTATYTVNEPPPIRFELDTIDPIRCFGFTTTLGIINPSGGNGASYAYSVDQAPLQDITFGTNVFSGPHIIEVFDSRNCSVDTTINITQPNPVVINIDPVIEVELGDSLRLVPQFNPGGAMINPDSIFWTPADQLSCDRCPNPVVRPFEDQGYLITVYDENGCQGDAEVFIEVDKNRNVFLPNAFSPNGDGINDEFRVFTGVGVQKVNYVRILDRWGEMIYEQKDIDANQSGIPTWDGFFQGKPMDPGVFIYLVEVEFEDDVTLLYRGDITLLR